MNKVESLPKQFYYKDDLYQIAMWVTMFGRLCIGYRNSLDVDHKSLCSVCVEPKNDPCDIKEPGSGWINEGIGNTKTLDDACDMLNKYIVKQGYIKD